MTDDQLFLANARLVLADEVIEGAWIVAANGVISEFGRSRPPARAEDMAGDLVIPGLVELHTDHIEAHYMPRPKVRWDPVSAGGCLNGHRARFGITAGVGLLRVWGAGRAHEGGGGGRVVAPASHGT